MRYGRPPLGQAMAALALFLCAAAAFAQEGPFIIKSVDFQVKGRSIPFVLMQKIEADGRVIGKSFNDEASLDAYIEDRRQVLINTRLLASVESSRDIAPNPQGGSDVSVYYTVVDTWNIIALPEPKYDSNTGLTLYVKGRDYNFFGSMQTLNLDLSYVSDTASNKSGEVATAFSLPFQALGAAWSLGVSEDYQAWTTGTMRSSTTAGITYNIPGINFPASVTATQGVYLNPDVYQTQVVGFDSAYMSEFLSATASIPLALKLGGLGYASYSPTLAMSQNWWPGTTLDVYGRQGFGLSLKNILSFGRADWMGNMREGAVVQVSSANSYNLFYTDFIWDLNASATAFADYLRKIGISGRLVAQARPVGHFPADDVINMGSNLRGIVDNRITGVAGLYANVSVPVKLFDFPTHKIIKKDWLDFELQAEPFVDAAVVLPSWQWPSQSDWASPDKSPFWLTGGLEFLVFPTAIRNFIVRAMIGWDLVSVSQTLNLKTSAPRDGQSPYELYFGTGVAY